ncbi:MAG: redoxin domain-containing protein [Ignavibacteria bacterium]|nr:redoxin domain-containing protein [Ignavibacteria bacterium]
MPPRDSTLEGAVHAPEFPAQLEWLNTDAPRPLASLRGKFVLLDFWSYCCINCLHILPDLAKLEARYADELVVIGVHSGKFETERGTNSIRNAIMRYGIAHAVVNDADYEVWNAYAVHGWPTTVLITPAGRIISQRSGEGVFEEIDPILRKAIAYFDAKGELKRSPAHVTLETSKLPAAALSFPGKISSDEKSGRLFISDTKNNRIIIADASGAVQSVIGGGKKGRRDGGFAEAEFAGPLGTCLAGDILYIADTENHLIRAADLKSGTVRTVLGTGRQGYETAFSGRGAAIELASPWDLISLGNTLYIAMAGRHQLWSADLAAFTAAIIAGSGDEARVDGPALEAALAQPSGLTTDGKVLYFADSETSSIRAVNATPGSRVRTIVGEDLFEFGDVDGGAAVARLQHPLGVVWKDGALYVADTYNHKIKRIDPVRRTSTTLAGTGSAGRVDGPRLEAQFDEPSGICALGNALYIADTNNHCIRVLDLATGVVSTLALTNLPPARRES